jgi:hypothetical protein
MTVVAGIFDYTCTGSSLSILGVTSGIVCCRKDLCNSSSNSVASKMLIALVLTFAIRILRLLKD